MPETARIDITAHARGVRIILHDRLWARSPDPWDADALGATIALHDGTQEVQALAVLWAHELVTLRGYLAACLSRTAGDPDGAWRALDGTLVLHLAPPDPQEGRLTVAVQTDDTGQYEQLEVGAPRGAVEDWLTQIDSVLKRFPSQIRHLHLETLPEPRDGDQARHGAAAETPSGRPRETQQHAVPHSQEAHGCLRPAQHSALLQQQSATTAHQLALSRDAVAGSRTLLAALRRRPASPTDQDALCARSAERQAAIDTTRRRLDAPRARQEAETQRLPAVMPRIGGPKTPEQEDLVSVAEAAEQSGVPMVAVYSWITRRWVSASVGMCGLLVSPSAVRAFAETVTYSADDGDEYVSPAVAAEAVGLTPHAIWRWAKMGMVVNCAGALGPLVRLADVQALVR